MKMIKRLSSWWLKMALVMAGIAAAFIPLPGRAQTTAFTYQGRLTDNGAPANGTYDLVFAVYDSASLGSAVTGSLTNAALEISNGLFTVTLDFGAQPFNGGARWLDIGARTNGANHFVTLNPRQLLACTPTAIFATTAATALNVAGTIPNGGLNGVYGSPVTFSNSANSFSGDGSGLVNVAGTLPARLVSDAAIQAQPNNAYVLTNARTVTVTLPPNPKIGDVVRVAGIGTGGWNLAQNDGQMVLGQNLVNPLTAWTQIYSANTLSGQTIASSADGTHLVAGFASFLEVSSDSGATWTLPAHQPFINSERIALSADGQRIATAGPNRQIYISSDFGNNWTMETNSPATNYYGIAISADGSHLAAVVNGGGIYVSSDFGNNWALTTAPVNTWDSIASSADGSKLVAAAASGGIYASTNFGAGWRLTSAPAADIWDALATSADGMRVIAVESGTNAWFSADGGQNWQPSAIGGSIGWSVACSADGLRVAAVENETVMLSVNGGLTWIQSNVPTQPWRAVAASASGNFVVTGNGTGVWAFKSSTTAGTNGYLSGGPFSSVEVQYCGNGQFLPVSHEGTLLTH